MAADGAEEDTGDEYTPGGADEKPAPSSGPLDYSDDELNLVPIFMKNEKGKEFLKETSEKVFDDFTQDWESSKEWRERKAKDAKLFVGHLPEKTWPFQNCANSHVPIMLKTISRVAFRVFSEVFGDFRQFVTVQPTSPDNEELADILTHHMNWQLNKKLIDFKRQMARATLMFFDHGDITCHSYYDPRQKRNCHDILTPDEFVVPYVFNTVMPDYSDVPHYTRIFRLYKHDLQARKDWFEVQKVIDGEPPSFDDEPEQLLRKSRAEVTGEHEPDDNKSAPFKILNQFCWLTLPGKDYECWCEVVLDYATKAILLLRVNEEEDWEDRERHDQQQGELDQHRAELQSHAEMTQQAMGDHMAAVEEMTKAHDELIAHAMQAATGPQHAQQIQQDGEAMRPPPPPPPELPPAPEPPDWVARMDPPADVNDSALAPEKIARKPIYMFTHAVCIEPTVGNLGIGFGRMEADYNRAANTMLSQSIDAATLANCRSFLYTGMDLEADYKVGPGKMTKVSGVSPADLKNAIVPIDNGPPNPQLLEAVDRMERYGDDAVQAPEVLSGGEGKSGETYRGQAGRIEQAVKQLSVPAGALADFVARVLKNHALLNAAFMPEEEIFRVEAWRLDPPEAPLPVPGQPPMPPPQQDPGKLKWLKAGREMYNRPFDVEIAADLRFTSRSQRVSEADEITSMVMQSPPLQTNGALTYWAVRNSLIARDAYGALRELGPKPPTPPMFGSPSFPGQPGAPPGGASQGGAPKQNASPNQAPPGQPPG